MLQINYCVFLFVIEIEECLENNNACMCSSPDPSEVRPCNTTCENTMGGFLCRCSRGYEATGGAVCEGTTPEIIRFFQLFNYSFVFFIFFSFFRLCICSFLCYSFIWLFLCLHHMPRKSFPPSTNVCSEHVVNGK